VEDGCGDLDACKRAPQLADILRMDFEDLAYQCELLHRWIDVASEDRSCEFVNLWFIVVIHDHRWHKLNVRAIYKLIRDQTAHKL
jgi:hypothetical protein